MKWKEIVIFLAAALALGWFINSLIDKNIELREKLNEQIKITTDYEKRINSLHELDTKHTTELTNAKAEIDKLRGDVRSGRKRVYINAECPSTESSSTSGVDVGRPTPVARDTEENILNLEEQLETLEKQYLGLRDWYFAECRR
ncbi:lysis protein [Moellerella wisconsensis]|uniref:lysis protein n=1 Tax=Morganellaceae TaxID=1903414 RepID=UPI000E3D90DC|nr:lysis protein [Providencia rettgeri]RFT09519.1 lysis protein [Providencia rettgeri]